MSIKSVPGDTLIGAVGLFAAETTAAAAAGAIAGAIAGPPGMAIGAIIGGVVGAATGLVLAKEKRHESLVHDQMDCDTSFSTSVDESELDSRPSAGFFAASWSGALGD